MTLENLEYYIELITEKYGDRWFVALEVVDYKIPTWIPAMLHNAGYLERDATSNIQPRYRVKGGDK